ncbi:conserved phage C-terminal domain-containing protein [Yokenella regensburgei]|uniref:conserved phage C-terminal domain-containing protein n=1 Tax=Yokenella regensburgei TaxID=158877 RepID=UPI003ED98D0D
MSVKLSAYVWDGCAAAGIKGNKLLIMLRLADFASDEGIAYPSVATIARQLGAGRSTVITLLGELEKGGWLTKKERRQGQRNTSNLYTLNVERLRQAAAGAFSHSPDSERPKAERSKAEGSDSERTEPAENQGSHGPETGHDPSVNSKPDPSGKSKPPCPVPAEPDPEVVITDHAKLVLTHLNQTTGSRFQVCSSSLDNIRARLREEFTPEELMLVVDYKHEQWRETKDYQYMRPKTLFIPGNFPGYLQVATRWGASGKPTRDKWGENKRTQQKIRGDLSGVSDHELADVPVDVEHRKAAYVRYMAGEGAAPGNSLENDVWVQANMMRLRSDIGTDEQYLWKSWVYVWAGSTQKHGEKTV